MSRHSPDGKEESIFFNTTMIRKDKTIASVDANIRYNLISPLVTKSNDWELGLRALSIPTQFFPIMSWENPESYYISILKEDTISTYPVQTQFVSSGYNFGDTQFVYFFNQITESFNNAVKTAVSQVNSDFPGTVKFDPQLIYDPNDKLFKLFIGEEFGDGLYLCVSQAWFTLLFHSFDINIDQSFNFTLQTGIFQDYYNKILNRTPQPNNYFSSTATINALGAPTNSGPDLRILFTQNFTTHNSILNINRVRIEMSGTSIKPEFSQADLSSFEDNTAGSTTQTETNNVLLDLYPVYNSYNDQGRISYFPRVINYHTLVGTQTLQSLDFEFSYITASGNKYPIQLPINTTLNCKIELRKRNYLGTTNKIEHQEISNALDKLIQKRFLEMDL